MFPSKVLLMRFQSWPIMKAVLPLLEGRAHQPIFAPGTLKVFNPAGLYHKVRLFGESSRRAIKLTLCWDYILQIGGIVALNIQHASFLLCISKFYYCSPPWRGALSFLHRLWLIFLMKQQRLEHVLHSQLIFYYYGLKDFETWSW